MSRHVAGTLLVAMLLIAAVQPGAARAAFGFAPGTPTIEVLDAAGGPYAQAGGHPARITVKFEFATSEGKLDGNVKSLFMDFPPGFAGNPNAVAACPRSVYEDFFNEAVLCDPASQVGVFRATAIGFGSVEQPIHNIETAPGELALMGVAVFGKLNMQMRQRPGDFGLTVALTDLAQTVAIQDGEIELWGVPADHQEVTGAPRRPFITMPPRCDQGPLTITGRIDSWQEPGSWRTASASAGSPMVGCDTLQFDPAIAFAPASRAADTPSGASLELRMPSSEGPDDRVRAAPRAVEVMLPAGVSLSPGSVSGLAVCTDDELRPGTDQPATCPPAARVGTLALDVPQLNAPLEGRVYLGEERPDERFRLFLVAEGGGVSVKLVARLRLDPGSGRIGVTLDDLPAIGFRSIRIDFDGGHDALLATPLSCGPVAATASFARHGAFPAADASSSSEITEAAGGGPCPAAPPFSPRFTGGTTRALAARHAGLTLTLSRAGGERLLDRFAVTLPRGLSADFGSVGLCPEAAVADADCPPDSRVGSAIATVGSGDLPAVLEGEVHLTGRYRRAPFGLALVFPARLGRFEMGSIAVRAALRVDPESGRLTVQSDALPTTIAGIPVRFRSVGLDVDRPRFIRTPTSCDPATLDADVSAVGGPRVTVSSPFRLRGCDSLGFSPRLSVALTGPRQLRRDGRPGVRIAIRAGTGKANLRAVDVGLPSLLRRDLSGLRSICARQDARDGRCAADSRVGSARVSTPLFEREPSGTVNLVQPAKDGLPELWATLRAEGVRLSVRARVFLRDGRVHTRLIDLPDTPLSKLVMRLDGGERGLLSLASDPCARGEDSRRMRSALEGWNRAYLIVGGKLGLPGCGGGKAKRSAVRVG